MRKSTTLLLISSLTLSGCGLAGLPFFSGGGGPTVNSNAQIGKENRQAVATYEQETNTSAGRDVIQTETLKEVEAGPVEKLLINNENIPPWVMLLLILGWLLPTPTEMGRGLFQILTFPFRRREHVQTRETELGASGGRGRAYGGYREVSDPPVKARLQRDMWAEIDRRAEEAGREGGFTDDEIETYRRISGRFSSVGGWDPLGTESVRRDRGRNESGS